MKPGLVSIFHIPPPKRGKQAGACGMQAQVKAPCTVRSVPPPEGYCGRKTGCQSDQGFVSLGKKVRGGGGKAEKKRGNKTWFGEKEPQKHHLLPPSKHSNDPLTDSISGILREGWNFNYQTLIYLHLRR